MINSSYFKSLSRFPLLGHSRNAPVAFLVTFLIAQTQRSYEIIGRARRTVPQGDILNCFKCPTVPGVPADFQKNTFSDGKSVGNVLA